MICNFCDRHIPDNEPHTECDMTPGDVCRDEACEWVNCIHAGKCIV